MAIGDDKSKDVCSQMIISLNREINLMCFLVGAWRNLSFSEFFENTQ